MKKQTSPYRFFKTKKEAKAYFKEMKEKWNQGIGVEGPPVIRVFNQDGQMLNTKNEFKSGAIPKLFQSVQGAINYINRNGLYEQGAKIGIY